MNTIRMIMITIVMTIMMASQCLADFNRKGIVLYPPPRDFAEMARNNGLIVENTTWLSNFEVAKEANPEVQTWITYSVGILFYDQTKHNDDPNEQGGFIEWNSFQMQYAIDAQMSVIVQENLKMGVDWFVRDHNGKPLDAWGNGNTAVLNVTAGCPVGVYDDYAGLNCIETYALLYNYMSRKQRFKDCVDAMYFDMYGNLWNSMWALRDSDMSEEEWYDPVTGWEPAYLDFLRRISYIDMPVCFNGTGEDPAWFVADGGTPNREWAVGYKFEAMYNQHGWRRSLPWPEKFLSYLGPYTKYNADGQASYHGLEWIKQNSPDGLSRTIVTINPYYNAPIEEARKHVRFCMATTMLSYEAGVGPYISLDLSFDGRIIDRSKFPEWETWNKLEPDGDYYVREIDGKQLYARHFTMLGRWRVVMIVNPNDIGVYGVAPHDALMIITDFLDFKHLMQWHKIL